MLKKKIAIVASVPIVMFVNLTLLNHYAGAITITDKSEQSISFNRARKESRRKEKSKSFFSRPQQEIKVPVILRCPPPPPHTFCGPDDDE